MRTLYGREFARIYLKRSEHSLVKRTLRKLGFTSLLDQDAEGSGSYGGAFGVRKRADVVNQEVVDWIDRDRQRPFLRLPELFRCARSLRRRRETIPDLHGHSKLISTHTTTA